MFGGRQVVMRLFRVYFVSETAQVELKSGAPASSRLAVSAMNGPLWSIIDGMGAREPARPAFEPATDSDRSMTDRADDGMEESPEASGDSTEV